MPLLFGLVAISIVATLIVLSLPPVLLGHRLPSEHGAIRALLYFLCIGAGYILIQVALIQKFVLFLGHPTYALTVIIFSMLISSGIGSYFSRRTRPQLYHSTVCCFHFHRSFYFATGNHRYGRLRKAESPFPFRRRWLFPCS